MEILKDQHGTLVRYNIRHWIRFDDIGIFTRWRRFNVTLWYRSRKLQPFWNTRTCGVWLGPLQISHYHAEPSVSWRSVGYTNYAAMAKIRYEIRFRKILEGYHKDPSKTAPD